MPPTSRTRRQAVCIVCALAVLCCPELGFSETTNLLLSADTSLIESFPSNNIGGATFILAGTGENLKRHRALLKCDLAGQIPPGSKIKSASLTLELAWLPANGYAQSTMGLHRLLQPWGEGIKLSPTNCGSCTGQGTLASTNEANWFSRFAFAANDWYDPGGAATNDYLAVATSSTTIYKFADSPYHFFSPQMAADAQLWLDTTQTNFGWILIGQDESVKFTARRFYSREDSNFPPSLTIEYVPPPPIDRVQVSGNQFNLFFTAPSNETYIVESRGAVSAGAWQTLANVGPFPDDTRVVIIDPIVASQRFYRVRAN